MKNIPAWVWIVGAIGLGLVVVKIFYSDDPAPAAAQREPSAVERAWRDTTYNPVSPGLH